MGTIRLSSDFKEFLKLLQENNVRYLLVGGYAVAFHGYPRTTGDMDIWVAVDQNNVSKVIDSLKEFGFNVGELTKDLFSNPQIIIRMGVPPYRIEIITSADGVNFEECYSNRVIEKIDDIDISLISKKDLISNKKAAGRNKDLNDVENLE